MSVKLNEPMMEMYIFETSQNLEQLESLVLLCEDNNNFSEDSVNEIFRIMHTIKGSSAMMLFHAIAELAHSVEDLFYFIREEKPQSIDNSGLADIILAGLDFMKTEMDKIKSGQDADGNSSDLTAALKEFLAGLKQLNSCAEKETQMNDNEKEQYYISPAKTTLFLIGNMFRATIFFEEGCEMEHIRAYTVVLSLKEMTDEVYFEPEDIIENDKYIDLIREQGFTIYFKADNSYQEMEEFLQQTTFLKELKLVQIDNEEEFKQHCHAAKVSVDDNSIKLPPAAVDGIKKHETRESISAGQNQGMISVNVSKLDRLMDLVGEIVIAEAMITQNPELKDLEIGNFQKAARQLHKITGELQDLVMSVRMVPLTATFQKMHRIVRDMSKKLNKEVNLVLLGEDTEVDKNIIEHISDPLMHLIRNAIDHGLEHTDDRELVRKPKIGTITLEAKNAGNDVVILVKDDGKGMNKEKILKKALENGILPDDKSELSEKEIFNLILLPGFSTKENITEFSGRGVGMDVVTKNLETVGGSVLIDSVEGKGTTITLKIPLTLAIIDGMNVEVGKTKFTIPIIAIKESFKPGPTDVFMDPDGNEMILVRGECYPIMRLHQYFSMDTEVTNVCDGILIMVEQDGKTVCLLADRLIGQQQVVVKTLPAYIKNTRRMDGLAGCTLLGDGSISLILNIGDLLKQNN